jgi:Flp pilus assembly protein TadG
MLNYRSCQAIHGLFAGERVRTSPRTGTEGNALIELALTLPIIATMLVGVYKCGFAFNNYLMLTNAVSQGVYQLQQSANQTLDPCQMAYTAVTNAAPQLASSQITFSLSLNNGADVIPASTGSFSCSSSSYTTGAAGNLLSNTSVTLTLTYPFDLTIMGINFAPAGGVLSATSTEEVQ